MSGHEITAIERLRERAMQCRERARQALSDAIACELEKLASDHDRDANRADGF